VQRIDTEADPGEKRSTDVDPWLSLNIDADSSWLRLDTGGQLWLRWGMVGGSWLRLGTDEDFGWRLETVVCPWRRRKGLETGKRFGLSSGC